MNIPWAKPYIGKEEQQAVQDCFDRGWLTLGPKAEEFELELKTFTGSPYCVAVNSGTAALDIALKLLDIKPGDEIIIPALAYMATGACVLYQGATPVFADIDPDTFNIDPDSVEQRITSRTRGLIAIDYAGHPADWDVLRRIAQKHGFPLIEDAAPGLGGIYKGKPLCSRADIGITSFHMAKVLTSVEGGMLFLTTQEHDHKARMLRSQGESAEEKYLHPMLGHNYRISDLHAAIGVEQMKKADAILKKRRYLAEKYLAGLADNKKIRTPTVMPDCTHAWFLFPTLVDNRDRVARSLNQMGISTNISWPKPIYRQQPFMQFRHESCPVTEHFVERVLCLPMYYSMTDAEHEYVTSRLLELL